MDCNRCPTQKEIDALLARHPNGDAPEQELARLRDACYACSHDCRRCPRRREIALLASEVAALTRAGAAADRYALAAKTGRLRGLRAACATCTRSADDSPTHRGCSHVSLDAGAPRRGAGSDGADANGSLQDYILLHRSPVYDSPSSTVDPGAALDGKDAAPFAPRRAVPRLDPDVEDRLRVAFASFFELDLVSKILLCLLVSEKPGGGHRRYTLADFARMAWIPDSLTRPMTKQAAHNRFRRIVQRNPVFAALAHGMLGRGKYADPSRARPPKPRRAAAKRPRDTRKDAPRTPRDVRLGQLVFDL